jgi:membrane-associated phospholipid phosphatase
MQVTAIRGGRALTIGAPVVYLVALAISVATQGLPLARDALFFWLALGMAAFSISAWRTWGLLVLEWLPFLGLLIAYDYVRGAASVDSAHAHVWPQIDADRALFFGHVPSVWLQQHLHEPGHIGALDIASWCVYMTHFFAVWVTAAILWRVAHDRFRRYVAVTVLVTVAALLTYWLFPAQPPWMASVLGDIGPVDRIVPQVWGHMGVDGGRTLFETGNGLVNMVAAMPSLHAAYPMMLLLFFWSAGWRARLPLGLYTLAMAFVLVYGGEHFVIDILVGWLFALIAFGLVAALWRLPAQNRISRPSAPQEAVVPGFAFAQRRALGASERARS